MKLIISCMQCLVELGRPSEEFNRVEFSDDGRYEITCSKGHETVTVLQNQKFEILFDIGAYAILDGYYREAISSFSSSLEIFYEFAIKVLCENSGVSEEIFKDSWKLVASQSERQLGAFTFLWLSSFKSAPELLSNNQMAFRNEVVHKGKIPTKNEAIMFGDFILKIIQPKISLLKEKFPEEIRKVIFYHLRGSQNTEKYNKQQSTMGIKTILSLNQSVSDPNFELLETSLIEMEKRRKIFK